MGNLTSYDLAGPNPRQMTIHEVDALKSLVNGITRKQPIIVQIGAERGTSTLAMLEERPDAFIFSIDVGECPGEFENLKSAGLEWQRVFRVLGKSQDIGKFWPIRYDLIFIDGDHSEAGVRADILGWIKMAYGQSIMVFHDYIPDPPPEIKGRVARAVDDLMIGKYEEILRCERLIAFKIP